VITEKIAKDCLKEKTKGANFSYSNWMHSEFSALKLASTTDKGNIGEDFFAELLRLMGYKNVTVVEGRRGDYDIAVKQEGKECLIEVKVATRDMHSNFQFNGVRHDTKYTHLFCLGISPNSIGYLIIPKKDLDEHKLVSMAKGSNATFKITKKDNLLRSFDLFENDVKTVMNSL